jgi:hypothetical protein
MLRAYQMADAGFASPWDGEMDRATFSGEDIIHRQYTARFQDSPHLVVEPGFVRDVHGGVLGPEDIKMAVCKRHIEGIAMVIGDAGVKAESLRKHAGDPAILLRKIDPCDLATELSGKAAGRTAETTADIQDLRRLVEAKLAGKFEGGLATAYVEFINGRQVFSFKLVQINSRLDQGCQDNLFEVLTGVVIGYIVWSQAHG